MARTVLVTGAGRGLGLEFARQLAARGDTVIATARRPGEARELSALALGPGGGVMTLDVADEASIEALARDLRGRAIDVLINNAGISSPDPTIEKVTMAEMTRVLTTNVAAPAVLTRALLPSLRAGTGKRVANITSVLGSIAQSMPGYGIAYGASKAALNMVTARMGKELGKEGFVCVALHPGWVKTDMGGPNAPLTPEKSIGDMLSLIDRLTPAENGAFLDHRGQKLPW